MGRAPDLVEHDLETLLAQRVHGIALGYEDLNDHDALRRDPVLGLVSGKLEALRSSCAVLAGKSTLHRLEHAPEDAKDRYRKFTVHGEAMQIRSMAIRSIASSTVFTNATAICRSMVSAAATCCWPSCGPPTLVPAQVFGPG